MFLLIVPLLVSQVLLASMARALYVLIGIPFFYFALALLPTALGISFRRHHLWNLDLLLNRTLVYLPLTAILAGLFEALEFITRTLFTALTGQESDLRLIISRLLVAAAFAPIKDALQGLVDKRFKEAPNPAPRWKPSARVCRRACHRFTHPRCFVAFSNKPCRHTTSRAAPRSFNTRVNLYF